MDSNAFREISNFMILGNSVVRWVFAFMIFGISFALVKFIKNFTYQKLLAISTKTETIIDDLIVELIAQTKTFFIFFTSVFFGLHTVSLPEKYEGTLSKVAIVIGLIQLGIWGAAAIQFWVENVLKKKAEVDSTAATTIGLINFIAKSLLYVLIFLMMLNNLGVNITALIAGLGLGGIAIGLALQNILGDLFGSLAIVLDKPFMVGDFVVVGDFSGTIENLGMKTTRFRSLSGEQLIFPNSDLLKSRIRNYKRMQERRVVFQLGFTYDTTAEQLREIPPLIQKTIESKSKVRFERSHFSSFGDSSLNFETVWWVLDSDYKLFMDLQQAIYLELYEAFAKLKVNMAFPSRTLYLANNSTINSSSLQNKSTTNPATMETTDTKSVF